MKFLIIFLSTVYIEFHKMSYHHRQVANQSHILPTLLRKNKVERYILIMYSHKISCQIRNAPLEWLAFHVTWQYLELPCGDFLSKN